MPTTFDINDRKYKCCCGVGPHIKQCSLVIGGLQLVAVTIFLISVITMYFISEAANEDKPGDSEEAKRLHALAQKSVVQSLVSSCILYPISLLIIALMIYGVMKEKHILLIPHMIWQALFMFFLAIWCVLYFLEVYKIPVNWNDDSKIQKAKNVLFVYLLCVIGYFGVLLVLEGLFLAKIFRCHRYIREKAKAAQIALLNSPRYSVCIPRQDKRPSQSGQPAEEKK